MGDEDVGGVCQKPLIDIRKNAGAIQFSFDMRSFAPRVRLQAQRPSACPLTQSACGPPFNQGVRGHALHKAHARGRPGLDPHRKIGHRESHASGEHGPSHGLR